MADIFSKQKRSEVMSKIRGKGNKDTELAMVRIFRDFKISGWRRNQSIFGKPDFTFRKKKVVIFIDGCFWHSCPFHSTIPKNNNAFWGKKLNNNKIRDKIVTKELIKLGWVVVRVWEHELKNPDQIVMKILKKLIKSKKDSPTHLFIPRSLKISKHLPTL